MPVVGGSIHHRFFASGVCLQIKMTREFYKSQHGDQARVLLYVVWQRASKLNIHPPFQVMAYDVERYNDVRTQVSRHDPLVCAMDRRGTSFGYTDKLVKWSIIHIFNF
jgi:hypothetical protein